MAVGNQLLVFVATLYYTCEAYGNPVHSHQKAQTTHRHDKGTLTPDHSDKSPVDNPLSIKKADDESPLSIKKTDKALATCTTMANHGTYFTVEVEVGTPAKGTDAQTFSVVADTGSNHLIVPSCICNDNNACEKENRCFRGHNHSSTFLIGNYSGKMPPTFMLSFGSGQIAAAIASDVAKVGDMHAKMNQSLLLMVNKALDFSGPFEGILGLGLPSTGEKYKLQAAASSDSVSAGSPFAGGDAIGDEIQKIIDGLKNAAANGAGDDSQTSEGADGADTISGVVITPSGSVARDTLRVTRQMRREELSRIPFNAPVDSDPVSKDDDSSDDADAGSIDAPPGFLEEAGINSFSMCMNDGGANGTLRLGVQPSHDALGSVGTYHWGLGLKGISIGDATSEIKVCSPKNMSHDQESPCGAIPDSGTTNIMAPAEQISLMKENICDKWERCRHNHSLYEDAQKAAHAAAVKVLGKDPFEINKVKISKADVLTLLLQDCKSWLQPSLGLNELPSLHFHVQGKNNKSKTLELSGWSYVVEAEEEMLEKVYKDVEGFGKLPVGTNKTGETQKVCSLALGEMDYTTQKNGPVFILGTPLFYEFQVGYHLQTKPPSMSFSADSCTSCNPTAALLSQSRERKAREAHIPRKVHGAARVPKIDMSKPL